MEVHGCSSETSSLGRQTTEYQLRITPRTRIWAICTSVITVLWSSVLWSCNLRVHRKD